MSETTTQPVSCSERRAQIVSACSSSCRKNYHFCTIHSAADFKCTQYGDKSAECFVNVKEDEYDHIYNVVYVEASQLSSFPSF